MSSVNYIEILKETLEEIRFKLKSDEIMLQMENSKWHWSTCSSMYLPHHPSGGRELHVKKILHVTHLDT